MDSQVLTYVNNLFFVQYLCSVHGEGVFVMVAKGSEDYQSDLLTAREAASYLRVSESTFQRLVRSGDIPSYSLGKRIVRYRRQDLDIYIESQQRTTAEGK